MNTARIYRPDQAQHKAAHVSEVIIPQTGNAAQIIFPLVASMSHQKEMTSEETRWLTWLTDRKPTRQQLASYGVIGNTIRVVHINRDEDNRWLLWEALSTGNSHTVIADIEHIHNQDMISMEDAAQQGQTQGLLIRSM